ncbi:unnamed protein product [Owenia fusiformis]|uniref:Uncharacterized protein n=1 Tax=Owenia fusiformis TaxID=6347 RepID=A0A8J1XIX3_OWEFU|nr:unnamed protein product [Owenia fusiformis]
MSEERRVELMPADPTEKPKKTKKTKPTLRFSLTLGETTEKTCPEFSYVDLVRKALGPVRETQKNDKVDPKDKDKLNKSFDPFGDPLDCFIDEDHGKLEALAKSFEQKYGGPTKKKRRQENPGDLVNLGEGYDVADPFIDDSEAYDEIVPQSLDTAKGGFYINSGRLDFRQLSDSDDEFKGDKKKKKKKIRRITSESESETETAKKIKKKKKKLKDGEERQKIKSKKRMISGMIPGENPLKKSKKDIPPPKEKTGPSAMDYITGKIVVPENEDDLLLFTNGELDGMEVNDVDIEEMHTKIDSTIDSVLNQGSSIFDKTPNISTSKEPIRDPSQTAVTPSFATNESNISNTGPEIKVTESEDSKSPENAPKLPAGLSKELESVLEKLKDASTKPIEGKSKFFTTDNNKLLLQVENLSRQLNSQMRSAMYNHLAAFLPCGKETLVKRAKKLQQNEQDDILRVPINKLKDAIIKVMPEQIEKYQRLVTLNKIEQNEKETSTAESDVDDNSQGPDDLNKATDKDEKKKTRAPTKKFEWSEPLRVLLCNVVRLKMQAFNVTKVKGQTAEEFLKNFLDSEIKPLWPKGWMQTRTLFKESRAAHSSFTNTLMQKPKKTVIVTKTSNTNTLSQVNGSLLLAENKTTSKSPVKDSEGELAPVKTILDYAAEMYTASYSGGLDPPLQAKPLSSSTPVTLTNTAQISNILKAQSTCKTEPTKKTTQALTALTASTGNATKVNTKTAPSTPLTSGSASHLQPKKLSVVQQVSVQKMKPQPLPPMVVSPVASKPQDNSFIEQFKKFTEQNKSLTSVHQSGNTKSSGHYKPVKTQITQSANEKVGSNSNKAIANSGNSGTAKPAANTQPKHSAQMPYVHKTHMHKEHSQKSQGQKMNIQKPQNNPQKSTSVPQRSNQSPQRVSPSAGNAVSTSGTGWNPDADILQYLRSPSVQGQLSTILSDKPTRAASPPFLGMNLNMTQFAEMTKADQQQPKVSKPPKRQPVDEAEFQSLLKSAVQQRASPVSPQKSPQTQRSSVPSKPHRPTGTEDYARSYQNMVQQYTSGRNAFGSQSQSISSYQSAGYHKNTTSSLAANSSQQPPSSIHGVGNSGDAVITGPAPGTYSHVLHRSPGHHSPSHVGHSPIGHHTSPRQTTPQDSSRSSHY